MPKEKKEVTKKKFKFKKFLVVLLVLYLFGFGIFKIFVAPIKNIFISNNKYLTDQEVIDIGGLRNYPSFLLTFKSKIKSNLLEDDLIKSVKISKKMWGKIYIEITENKPLFYYLKNKETILDNNSYLDTNKYVLPILVNNVDSELLKRFTKRFSEVNDETRNMISEIKYVPNTIDKERFIFTMNDGNYVYITLYKTSLINDYLKILSTLDNKKGILYLDSGNYFKILE